MDLDNNKNTDIYVDQINIFTLIIILFKVGRKKIHRIFYDNYYLPKFLDFFLKSTATSKIFPFMTVINFA